MKKKVDLVQGAYSTVKVRKLRGAKPTGTFILVEKLTEAECADSPLFIPNGDKSDKSNQAYVVEVGPSVEVEKYGIRAGDRVLLQGSFVPLPTAGPNGRELAIVNPYDVKAVLLEESEILGV